MQNMGLLDRIVRLGAAFAIAYAFAIGLIGGTLAIVMGVVALVLLLTSLTAVCPAYMPFGLSTRRTAR